MRHEIEDGFGCAGLVPSGREKRDEAYRQALLTTIEQLRAEKKKLRHALFILYREQRDYIQVNHLGPVHHNKSMQDARDALDATGGSTLE